ncbi:helix-turn-helix domain-containing protein [Rhodobium gokarnense]|uniref:Transcriptional regulator with XRE-family HTH domain n=1 Tax=Rhodobium gokarnense TaxID=364296 RepID=A0ABT3HC35_9HYPH|nr:XRE family transcriptional regulator [Rhodobium gokarnense]MCW2307962.1 transcriptional regulator with XRE-family HTH domain [Rhodobium gokarnense]
MGRSSRTEGTASDPPRAEQSGVGADIRLLRKSRKVPLTELAAELKRSVGWLSQVERGLGSASIADLRIISRFFSVPISFFFRNEDAPPEERGLIVRAGARQQLGTSETGLTEELLSPDLSGDFEMLRSVFAPGTESGPLPARPTNDGGIVVAGELELSIGERTFRLGAGDSFQYRDRPTRWRNPGKRETVIFWVCSPPVY